MNLNYSFLFSLLLVFFFFAGCKKKKVDAIDEPIAGTTIGAASGLNIYGGKERVKLTWKQPAASDGVQVSKYRVFWNNNTDSLEVPIATTDTVAVIINNLADGNYVFSVYAYDNKGGKSQRASVSGRAYGSKYEASLTNRAIARATYNVAAGSAVIDWSSASPQMVALELEFTDKLEALHQLRIPASAGNVTLDAYKPGSSFTYRTAYLPEPAVIDTFYTAYSSIVVDISPATEEDVYATMVNLQADGPGDTYGLINRVLGGTAYEVPDCGHPVPHITEEFNNELNKNVFAFFAHVALDDDRCGATDRQRTEIKTHGPSSSRIKALDGDEMVFAWKFRIDAGFQSSSGFTHIHQIKAGDGTNEGSPIITITPRYGNPDKLEVIHTGNTDASSRGKVLAIDLAPFKGTWIEATEKMKFGTRGTYSLVLKRVSDGSVLLSYSNRDIDLWRSEATFCRPKWGIYRSLSNAVRLRDEKVLFADFAIGKK